MKRRFAAFCLSIGMLFSAAFPAEAIPSIPEASATEIVFQTEQTDRYTDLTWQEQAGCTGYVIAEQGADDPTAFVAGEAHTTFRTEQSATFQVTPCAEVVSLSCEPEGGIAPTVAEEVDAVRLSWSGSAPSYEIYRSGENGWELLAVTTELVYWDLDKTDSPAEYLIQPTEASEASASAESGDGSTAAASEDTSEPDGSEEDSAQPELTAPQLTCAQDEWSTVTLNWNAVEHAEQYEVSRAREGEDAVLIQTLQNDVTSYTCSDLEYGVSYTFTVFACSGPTRAESNECAVTASMKTPAVSAVWDSDGILVSWEQIPGCSGYRVYRKTANTNWKTVQVIESPDVLSWKDEISDDYSYTYTVRAYVDQDGTQYLSGYDEAGASAAKSVLFTPTVSAVPKEKRYIQISWDQNDQADGYRVYRKTAFSGWSCIKEIQDADTTVWNDTDVADGRKYTYTVRSYIGSGSDMQKSDYDHTGATATLASSQLFTPTVSAASADYQSVKIRWDQNRKADGYRVYRKTADTDWKRIKTISGADTTTCTDTGLQTGQSYIYTVRSYQIVDGEAKLSPYDHSGATAVPTIPALTIKAAPASASGSIEVSWNQPKGAEGYAVYYRADGGKWVRATTIKDASTCSYCIKNLEIGEPYDFTVRAYRKVSKKEVLGTYDKNGVRAVPTLATLSLSSVSAGKKGLVIKWKAVSGADSYRVYRKTVDSGWTRIATLKTSATSYEDQNSLSEGTKYIYTVRASKNGHLSGYNKNGISKVYYSYQIALNNNKLPTTIALPNVTREKYGTSGEGRALYAYTVGSGKNHMVLNFAIHGWEDNWSRDGYELTRVAVKVLEKLSANASTVKKQNWSVTVIPYANPDGIVSGTTNNGPGRCTTRRYNNSGELVKGGVDLNRCFPTGFSARTSARNYTGSKPLMAKEATALRSLIDDKKGSGSNIFIDVHGWTQQILTNSSGSGKIYSTLHGYFPNNSAGGLGGGYAARYAKGEGYDACLFEFPRNVTSHSVMTSKGYDTKFVNAVMDLVKNY